MCALLERRGTSFWPAGGRAAAFHAFARELMGVQLFWPERGFGTSMVQDPHGHGRGRGRKRAFVVFCADD